MVEAEQLGNRGEMRVGQGGLITFEFVLMKLFFYFKLRKFLQFSQRCQISGNPVIIRLFQ